MVMDGASPPVEVTWPLSVAAVPGILLAGVFPTVADVGAGVVEEKEGVAHEVLMELVVFVCAKAGHPTRAAKMAMAGINSL